MIAAFRRHQRGGVLVIVGAWMLVLVLLGALLYGIGWRIQQRQRLDSAMRESTRVVVQQWSYTGFAANHAGLVADASLLATARTMLVANLETVPGLVDPPETIAAQAQWTVVRAGGTCGAQTVPAPAVCGTVPVTVRSLPLGLPGTATLTLATVTMLDMTQ